MSRSIRFGVDVSPEYTARLVEAYIEASWSEATARVDPAVSKKEYRERVLTSGGEGLRARIVAAALDLYLATHERAPGPEGTADEAPPELPEGES